MRITLIPSVQWKTIAESEESVKDLLWKFAFPLILFSALGRDIGLFFVVKPVLGFSFNLVKLLVFNLVSWVAIPYLLILAASFLLFFTLPRLGIETDFLRILKLVIYTFTPLFILTFFIYLHPLLRLLIPIGIFVFIAYTLLVFWYGVQYLFAITLGKKLEFVVIAVAVAFAAIFLAQDFYSRMVGWVIPGMEAYVK